jgi:hypothetical protein
VCVCLRLLVFACARVRLCSLVFAGVRWFACVVLPNRFCCRGPFIELSSGARLVDLPGMNDTCKSRINVMNQYPAIQLMTRRAKSEVRAER